MDNKKKISGKLVFLIASVLILALYFLAVRPLMGLQPTALVDAVILVGLLLAVVVTVLVLIVSLIAIIFKKDRNAAAKRSLNHSLLLVILVALFAGVVGASQWAAYTPPIVDENGNPLPNSISSMEKVELGGVDQWLIVRGEDVNKPVLLFLSGGPGASEAARVLRFNQELEKHFVVVIWEQRGCGKSYPSINPKSDLSVEQYTSDLIELTNLLRERYDEEKIYLVGHSWGTIIGISAVQTRPDLFHAYISTSQMVDVLETDQIIYDMVMEYSLETGDTSFVRTLEEQGPPPYYGKSPIQPYSTLFGREYAIFEVPNIKNEEYRRDGDVMLLMLKQPEYGWLDRAYYLLGLMNTYNVVYPQLQEMDLRQDTTEFDLPVYMILGRNDMNNPSQIPEEYFHLINAPHKELIYFEESGHGMIWEEADLYHDFMINTVLADTYQQ